MRVVTNVGIGTNLHRAVIVLNVKLYPRKVCSRVKNNPIVLTIDFDFTSEQYRIHIKQNKIITPLNLNLGVYAHAPLHDGVPASAGEASALTPVAEMESQGAHKAVLL